VEVASRGDAGVVDDEVDRTGRGLQSGDDGRPLGGRRQIADEDLDVEVRELRGKCDESIFAPSDDDEGGAIGRETAGDREAYARRGTGDERTLPSGHSGGYQRQNFDLARAGVASAA